MITTVTFNPAIDKTALVEKLVPGALNRLHHVRQDAGGKGINVSKTLAAIGKPTVATGFVAGTSGTFICEKLQEYGVKTAFVSIEGMTRTNLKVLNDAMDLTELNEPGPRCTKADLDRLTEEILALGSDVTVLSGNVGPGVPEDIYYHLTEKLHEAGCRVILDADGALFAQGIKAHPDVIKPNRFELAQYFGMAEDALTPSVMTELARQLLKESTILCVVSMGSQGSLFVTRDRALLAPALKIPFQSAVGAGDAMVAGLACSLDEGLDLEETAMLAIALSAGACTTEGTQPAGEEVVSRLKAQVTWEEI